MNAQSSRFDYDDFEQYLLEAAKIDRAPSDLPSRLGVALGLGVPILVASEMASVLPTTTSLSAGAGVAEVSTGAAYKGVFAAFKASLGVGSSTLWSTAAKGIAVGVLSGAAVVGTVQAVGSLAGGATSTPHAIVMNSVAAERGNATRVAASTQPAVAQGDSANGFPPPTEAVAADETAGDDANSDDNARPLNRFAYLGGVVAPTGFAEAEPGKPVRRLPRPVFPEKTTAIARYPLIYDDVSALYDAPKKQAAAVPSAAPPAEVEPLLDPAELMAMRTKAIAQSRTLLGQSKGAQALLELNRFRKRVGDKHFGVDELLLHIEALAMLGRAKEAQADVAIVERLAPNSPALRQAQMLARSRFVR